MDKQDLLARNKMLIAYGSFIFACILVIWIFLTSTTYIQLGVAILLYPLLTFFAYKVFMDRNLKIPTTATKTHMQDLSPQTDAKDQVKSQISSIGVADIDKRAFLKLIGATGISFFLISIFGRRVESLLFGRQNPSQAPANTANANKAGAVATSPTEGYNISEIDDDIISYYGYTNKDGDWFIMKGDTETGTFRYSRGKSKFPDNWENRKHLNYDYLYRVFP